MGYLARKALAAWTDGHDEAAQACATVITEAVVTKYFAPTHSARRKPTLIGKGSHTRNVRSNWQPMLPC